MSETGKKKSVAEEVAERILNRMKEVEEAIQNGENKAFRWVKPFAIGAPNLPYSYETMKSHSGVNRLILEPNEYLTWRMMQDVNKRADSPGYQIRKGAKGSPLFFFKVETVIDKETGEPVIDEDTGKEKTRGIWKRYTVFSREDIVRRDNGEALPSKFQFEHFTHEDTTERMREGLDRFNRLFNYYCQKHGITVEIVKDGTQAYFSHDMRIRVPEMSNFRSVYDWITTLAHEMAHSTGVFLGRFDDDAVKTPEQAKLDYAKEELCAEISAQSIANLLMIQDDAEVTSDNAVAYIHSWSSFLKDRPNEVLAAARKSDKAVNMIMEDLREMELAEEQTKNNIEREEEER